MDIFNLFDSNACSIHGREGSTKWNWDEYFTKKKELKEKGVEVVLVDMINRPVEGSVPISNELFEGKYPEGTHFVLYCHSGGSSGFLQKTLSKEFPKYTFINLAGGIAFYPR